MPRPSHWLMTPALVACTWLLSAQSPSSSTQLADLEKRVADLEATISKTSNVTQIKAPFTVVGQDGRPILEVVASPNSRGTGAVLLARHPGAGGGVYVMDEAGSPQAGMGVASEGYGSVYVYNKARKIAAQINGSPAVSVWNDAGKNVAGMSARENRGRFSIWDGDARVVLIEDSVGAGSVTLMRGNDGQAVARLGVGPGGSGRLTVMGSEGKVGAAVLGESNGGGLVAVATKNGMTVAELGVSTDNRGLIQVFKPGGGALAVMSQGGPGNGGIIQVANPGGVKATLTTATTGGGFLQLISEGGVPTVEAGTLPNGRGTVRAGPFFKCTPLTASTPIIGIPGWTDCIVGGKEDK